MTGSAVDGEVLTGEFQVTPAGEGNHGSIRVANTYHFAYEDGTPYYSIGTTCYVWELQSDELIAQTLETLKNSAFNKIRFCVFRNIMITTWGNRALIHMKEHRWIRVC